MKASSLLLQGLSVALIHLGMGCATPPPEVVEFEPPAAEEDEAETFESDTVESYRHHLGVAYTHALLTGMNMNALLAERIEDGSFGRRDQRILDDNLLALRDLRSQYRVVLSELYEDARRRRRDRAMVPLIDASVRATEALKIYADTADPNDLARYEEERSIFVEKLREMSR